MNEKTLLLQRKFRGMAHIYQAEKQKQKFRAFIQANGNIICLEIKRSGLGDRR